MSTQDDRERSKRERIERIRRRLTDVTRVDRATTANDIRLKDAIKGILDLLADEL